MADNKVIKMQENDLKMDIAGIHKKLIMKWKQGALVSNSEISDDSVWIDVQS